jgi:hypothetical protein
MSFAITRRDDRPLPTDTEGELRCFVIVKNEMKRLPYLLEYHRQLGIERFFIVDNESQDDTEAFVRAQPDCHYFRVVADYLQARLQTHWVSAIVNGYGCGHWCLVIDADELFIYPDCERIGLRDFATYLDGTGAEAVIAGMIDMYGEGPVRDYRYERGQPFLESCPYFDAVPFRPVHTTPFFPEVKFYGGVRERVFFTGPFRHVLPPTLNKVAFTRWRRGMRYLFSTHFTTPARPADVQAGLLHFKFLPGAEVRIAKEVKSRTLAEWAAYDVMFSEKPDLSLMGPDSVRYRDTDQLEAIGLLKRSERYDAFVRERLGRR